MIHLKDTDLYVLTDPINWELVGTDFKHNNFFVTDKVSGDRFEYVGEVTAYTVPISIAPYIGTAGLEGVIAKQKFYSLLEANGVYFKNPMGDEPEFIPKRDRKLVGSIEMFNDLNDSIQKEWDEWNEFESKVIEKAVILKKK